MRSVEPTRDAGARVLRREPGRARLPRGRRAARPRAVRSRSPTSDGSLRALCHAGANLVPSGEGCAAFAAAARGARSRMIIGEAGAVDRVCGRRRGGVLPRAARGPPAASPCTRSPSRRRRRRVRPARLRVRPTSTGSCRPARPRTSSSSASTRSRRDADELPLAHVGPDRRGPLVALARGRRRAVQGRGLGVDAAARCSSSRCGSTRRRAGTATRRAACATSAACCSRQTPNVTLFVRTRERAAIAPLRDDRDAEGARVPQRSCF